MTVIHSLYNEPGTVNIEAEKCILCGKCVNICPAEIFSAAGDKININPDSGLGCIACGHCMMVCSSDAVTVTGRGLSPDDLSALPESEQIATSDQLKSLMQSRRSIRKFKDQPIAPETLAKIIDMASTAPMGIPPWGIGCVTVNGKEKVRQLADKIVRAYVGLVKVCKPWLLQTMRPFIGKQRYEIFSSFIIPLAKTYIEGHKQGHDLLFYDAPAVMIFHHSPYTQDVDAMIACTYAMLAAESLGLGTTLIGAAAPIIQRNKKLLRELGIPQGNTPAIALIIGYPAVHFEKTIKRKFSSNNIL